MTTESEPVPDRSRAAKARPSFRAVLPRMLLAFAIGTAGGTVFWYLSMPLPWMLGAMMGTAVASFSGVRLQVDNRVRLGMMLVLGTLLGSAFSPAILERAGEWSISLASLVIYVVLASLMVFWFYHRVARIDSRTAFFSGVPGGLAEMITLGIAAGGDDRKISLAHTTRIFLVVMTLPLAFRVFGDFDAGARARSS
ncbi:MAG: AbrB family transcriptional regulator, partial [Alphaproteobacteria bacterium]